MLQPSDDSLNGASPETACVPAVPAGSSFYIPPTAASPIVSAAPAPPEYELMGELGRGGMGIVYKARHTSLNRVVALKMVQTGQTDPQSMARFRKEAQAAAALDHPGIVPIYDFGEVNGEPFCTMALVEGDSLSGVLRKTGSLEPLQAAKVLAEIADAVSYAHERGILHRDLKPDNVLVDGQGRPRITDFGLARRIDGDANLTSPGAVVGTPAYMAPEQAQGQRDLTAAADIYSLGAMLHTLLVGKAPFSGDSAMDVLVKTVRDAPEPVRKIRPDVPEELEKICLRCLEKNPHNRYNSAKQLSSVLRAFVAGQQTMEYPQPQVAAKPAASAGGWKIGVAALLGVLVVGGAVAAWMLTRPSGSGEMATTPDSNKNVNEEPTWTKPVRQDFPLTVSIIDHAPSKGGVYQLSENKPIRLLVLPERDAYVGIWSLHADGTVVQLFPNLDEPDSLVRGGSARTIPGTKQKYTIEPEPAAKMEYLRVVASSTPWKPAEGEKVKDTPFTLYSGEGVQRWQSQQRGLVIRRQKKDTSSEPEALVAEVVLPYRVAVK